MYSLVKLSFLILSIFCFSGGISGQNNQASTIFFENNSHLIDKKCLATLNDIGQKCTSDTFSFFKIFAYADIKGSKKYNEKLSEKRANEVYRYLIQNFSIDTSKIYVTWLGEESDNIYDLHFPEAKIQQRCVDIIIIFLEHSEQ